MDLEPCMAAIRELVCSRCIERPPGGPPCAPLGKRCGIEVNLERLVEAVHAVDSPAMDSYVDGLHDVVCPSCQFRTTSQCPCPLESLLPLAVEAIESVEEHDPEPLGELAVARR